MGRAGATLLATEGARVVIADISQEKGQRVCQSIVEAGNAATFIQVDVCRSQSVQAMVERALAVYGRIDVLYHNAVDVRFVNEQDRRLLMRSQSTRLMVHS